MEFLHDTRELVHGGSSYTTHSAAQSRAANNTASLPSNTPKPAETLERKAASRCKMVSFFVSAVSLPTMNDQLEPFCATQRELRIRNRIPTHQGPGVLEHGEQGRYGGTALNSTAGAVFAERETRTTQTSHACCSTLLSTGIPPNTDTHGGASIRQRGCKRPSVHLVVTVRCTQLSTRCCLGRSRARRST